LFKDDAQEVDLAWYPVADPVEVLPFPSKVNSLDWSSHPWLAAGVGEVWDEPRTYNGRKALPYAVGLAPCKPAAVFIEGEVLDPELPAQIYNLDQFPACCLNVWTPDGGIEWDGAAEVEEQPPAGTSCATAAVLNVGQWYVYHVPGDGFADFWCWEGLTGLVTYRLRGEILNNDAGKPCQGQFGWGASCIAFAAAGFSQAQTPIDVNRELPDGETRISLQAFSTHASGRDIRFRVDPA